VRDSAVIEEIEPADGRRQWRFDLARANRRLLERAGIPASQIEDAGICTSCHVAEYSSHRAEHGQAWRFGAMIALADK
jgi:copper oxidase (laccase) domain-containing protein